MCEKIWEVRAQYDQENADLGYEHDVLQALLATYDNRSETSLNSLRVARERLEAFKRASVSSHLHLELYLSSSFGQFWMGVARFINEAVRVHRTGIIELVSSASDTLELESRYIVQVLRSPERMYTVFQANPDFLTRSPDPSS